MKSRLTRSWAERGTARLFLSFSNGQRTFLHGAKSATSCCSLLSSLPYEASLQSSPCTTDGFAAGTRADRTCLLFSMFTSADGLRAQLLRTVDHVTILG